MPEKIARLMNLSEEEYAEIIENAWRERHNTGFVFFAKRGENGKEYLIKFRSQEGLNRFNNAVRAILEYKNPTEKFAEIYHFSEERAEQIFSTAKKNSVDFKVFLIEGRDSEYYKNYRLRFASRKDLNKFRKVCFPD